MKKLVFAAIIAIISFCSVNTAEAVILFGQNFDDAAFGDDATRIQGDVLFFGFGDAGIPLTGNFEIDLDSALTGADLFTMIEGDTSAQNPYVVEIAFLDNYLFNGLSTDLAVYERGLAESFGVSIFDSRINDFTPIMNFLPTNVGELVGSFEVSSGVNLAEINFSLWDFPSDLAVSKIRLHGREADIAAIGGLNSIALPPQSTPAIPEPSALLLFGVSLIGLSMKRFCTVV